MLIHALRTEDALEDPEGQGHGYLDPFETLRSPAKAREAARGYPEGLGSPLTEVDEIPPQEMPGLPTQGLPGNAGSGPLNNIPAQAYRSGMSRLSNHLPANPRC